MFPDLGSPKQMHNVLLFWRFCVCNDLIDSNTCSEVEKNVPFMCAFIEFSRAKVVIQLKCWLEAFNTEKLKPTLNTGGRKKNARLSF